MLSLLPKALYNVTILRGRRRITRLVFLVLLSGLVLFLVRHGLCVMRGESCYGRAEDASDDTSRKDGHNSGPHRRINGETTDASLKVSELQIGDEDFQDDGELQDEYHQDNDFQDGNVAEGESESDVDSIQDNQLQDNQVQNSDSQAQDGQAQDGQGQDSQEEGIPGDINNDGAHQNELQESPSNADTQEAQSMPDAAGKGEAPEKAATSKKESLQQPGAITLSKSNLKKEPERLPPPKPAVDQQSIRETRAAQPKQGTMVMQKQPPRPPAPHPLPRKESVPTPSVQERKLSAAEVAQAIKNGEMCKTVCPPFVWSEWSPCSRVCGPGKRYRKAIYEFVCQASETCPLNRLEESVCDTPCEFDPKKYGGPGGLEMYPINPLNPPIYPEDRHYMCGHWLVEYEKIHNEILTGKRPPSYLVYSTGRGDYPTAGGISGRLRGITTVFFMAVLLERAFLIEWVDPPGLEDYLEPKSFNWADLTPIRKLKRGPVRDIGSWRSARDSGKSSQWYMNTNFSTYLKFPVEVVQGHRYDFTYAVLRNPELMPKAFELGVDRIKCRICCAFDMLFKMTAKFEKEMDGLLKTLGRPSKPLVTVQLRTKDGDVQAAMRMAEQYIGCAMRAGKELKLRNTALVPVFNNRLVMHMAVKKYSDRMKNPIHIDTATRTVHNHLGNLPPDTEVEVAKGVQERSFKDFFLVLNSTVLVRTKGYVGSFGNVADAIRRHYNEPGSFWTYTAGGNTCVVFPDNFKIE